MNELVWFVDEALLGMTERPLAVLSIVLGALLGITAVLVICSLEKDE